MNISIRSITDIITNSSSEAFIYKLDDPEYAELKDYMLQKKALFSDTFIEIKSLDDVKSLVINDNYYHGWQDLMYDCCGYTPKPDWIFPEKDIFGDIYDLDDLMKETGKTKEELWEEYKHDYDPVVGYAYASLSNNSSEGPIDEIEAIWDFYGEKYAKKLHEFFSGLKPGKIYSCHVKDDRNNPYEESDIFLWNLYPENFVMLYLKGDEFSAAYNPGYRPDMEFIDTECGEYLFSTLDLSTFREATEEEAYNLLTHLEKKGYKVNMKTYELESM